MPKGIFALWEINDWVDCWVLHRSLLDRLFHLNDLNQNDTFDLFDDWSFKVLLESAGGLRSDQALKGQIDDLVEEATPDQKIRYQRLAKNRPGWRRPKAEDVAKRMGLSILYRYGYDYASRYVHPMAVDGRTTFTRSPNWNPSPQFTGRRLWFFPTLSSSRP